MCGHIAADTVLCEIITKKFKVELVGYKFANLTSRDWFCCYFDVNHQ